MANYLKKKNIFPSEITLLSMVLFLHLLFPLVVNSYDNLAVNCGHSIDTIFGNRKWVGDVEDSKLFSIIEPQIGHRSIKAEVNLNSDFVNQIPFASTRIKPNLIALTPHFGFKTIRRQSPKNIASQQNKVRS
jgi:hypothetical protein